jgi:hypothetical protein
MEIDLVYLWVDGNDPLWRARKRSFTGRGIEGSTETNCKGRWVENGELRYSLRSLDKFAPWIRRVFIVTDGQTPAWLDTSNPRVRVVDHREIMPPEALPCFNSSVIEHYVHRIPGLAEHFLYANDDMFFGAPVEPGFFFTSDGRPILRLKAKMFGKLRFVIKKASGIGFGNYRRELFRSARLVEAATGKYYSSIPHHNIDAYTVTDYRNVVENVFADQVARSLGNRIRTEGDFQRSAIGLHALATGRARRKFIGRSESLRISVFRPYDYMEFLKRYEPRLFCLNDNQKTTDADRARIRPFLESLFPHPSGFERGA